MIARLIKPLKACASVLSTRKHHPHFPEQGKIPCCHNSSVTCLQRRAGNASREFAPTIPTSPEGRSKNASAAKHFSGRANRAASSALKVRRHSPHPKSRRALSTSYAVATRPLRGGGGGGGGISTLPYSHTRDMALHMKTTLNIDDTVMRRLRQEARQGREMCRPRAFRA